MKKTRVGGKTEIGNVGKNAKVGSSFPTGGRLLSVATGKTSTAPSFKTAKPHKSSTSLGVIWIPRRKTNKYYKDKVYNSHKNDRSYDRSPSMFNYMSEDSSNHETLLKKKDSASGLLVPESSGHSSLAAASAGAAVAAAELPHNLVSMSPDEKQDLLNPDKQDDQEAASDVYSKEKDKESKLRTEEDKEVKSEKVKLEDNVDSVFLHSPPPHKVRSTTATPEQEEDCGITCLYYTMQCCECIIM